MSNAWKKHAVVALAVAVWLPTVAFGINVLWKYSTTPGHPATAPSRWPAHAAIERAGGRATLVIFVHPQCPCSTATIGELAVAMSHVRDKVDANVMFYRPASQPTIWVRGDLWKSAAAIPGVHTFEDQDGAIAQRFGAFTSGQTLLYDSNGHLLFKGGITAYRGHSGDNAGRSTITALLQGNIPPQDQLPLTTPVFGCSLQGE
jgi:hypothetical protein